MSVTFGLQKPQNTIQYHFTNNNPTAFKEPKYKITLPSPMENGMRDEAIKKRLHTTDYRRRANGCV